MLHAWHTWSSKVRTCMQGPDPEDLAPTLAPAHLLADGVRFRLPPLQRPIVRVRCQRLELRQGFGALLVRLGRGCNPPRQRLQPHASRGCSPTRQRLQPHACRMQPHACRSDSAGLLRQYCLEALAPHHLDRFAAPDVAPEPPLGAPHLQDETLLNEGNLSFRSTPFGTSAGPRARVPRGSSTFYALPCLTDGTSVPNLASSDEGELLCMVALVRHGDRTPKQKLKFTTREPTVTTYHFLLTSCLLLTTACLLLTTYYLLLTSCSRWSASTARTPPTSSRSKR